MKVTFAEIVELVGGKPGLTTDTPITGANSLEEAGPADLVLECSAEPSVLAGYGGSPRYLVNTNLLGTINCLEYARKHGAGLIFLSTSRVYPFDAINRLSYSETATRFALDETQPILGASARGISEQFPLEGPRSLYGATKLCSELLMREYIDMYGLKGIINRCGVLTGPWQMGKIDQGVVVLWVARHIYGGSLKYIGFGGAGKQVRDMLHIEDLLELIRLQIARLDEWSGQLFNVGGGNEVSVSLLELTALCEDITGNTIPIERSETDRPADIRLYVTDNSRVTQTTGWRPQRGVRVIIEDIRVWIEEHREVLRPILS